MPFLGEVPITAFFSRVESTSTKRKVTTRNKSSSNKKRRTDDGEAIPKAPSIDNSKRKKSIRGSSNVRRKERECPTSPVALEPNSGKKQGGNASFLTPPPVCSVHVTTHKTPSPALCPQPVSNPIDGIATRRRTFFLPTPTTMPRPQSYHPGQSHRHSVAPDSQDPVLEHVHSSIHCTPSRNPRNLFSMSSGRSQPATPKRRDSFHDFIQREFLQKGVATSFEDLTSERMAVGSSQSQLLSPVHESPQRPHKNSERLRRSTSSDDDSIPSSQIQEREFTVSSAGLKSKLGQMEITLLLVCFYMSSYPTNQFVRTPSFTKFSNTSQVPTRTLSDELFSVPIQSTILSDVFPPDSVQESQPSSAIDASLGTAENMFDGSATESETDNEREGTNPYSDDGTPLSQPESFPASLGISSSSLPPIVQVFHDMSFGNDDDSYPPDFPMSLRS